MRRNNKIKENTRLPRNIDTAPLAIIGRNPVRQLIDKAPNKIIELMISDSFASMDATGQDILKSAQSNKVVVKTVHKEKLFSFGQGHQGFVALVHNPKPLPLDELIDSASQTDEGIFVALDGVQDPQNLGSILRACDAFGVSGVFWSKNRTTGLTALVSKVSSGASMFVPIYEVSNLRDAIQKLKKIGYDSIATIIDENAVELNKFSYPRRAVLILGSEGDGIQPLIAKEASHKVYAKQYGVVDSLNVGQAAAVFLSRFWI